MSQNWKDNVDGFFRRKEEQKRLEQQRQQLENERQRIEAQKREEEVWAKNLANLQRRFKCHVCGKPSSTPQKTEHDTRQYDYGIVTGGSVWVETNWDVPGDFIQCSMCQKWTCDAHIHRGICQRCAEKL